MRFVLFVLAGLLLPSFSLPQPSNQTKRLLHRPSSISFLFFDLSLVRSTSFSIPTHPSSSTHLFDQPLLLELFERSRHPPNPPTSSSSRYFLLPSLRLLHTLLPLLLQTLFKPHQSYTPPSSSPLFTLSSSSPRFFPTSRTTKPTSQNGFLKRRCTTPPISTTPRTASTKECPPRLVLITTL